MTQAMKWNDNSLATSDDSEIYLHTVHIPIYIYLYNLSVTAHSMVIYTCSTGNCLYTGKNLGR